MPKAKKKTLPKNIDEMLAKGDLDALKAIFDTCDINARGGLSKVVLLAFDLCPDELARWLVAQGADLSAADSYGNTPLHRRARSRRSRIDVLLELGADINSNTSSIGTPLHAAAHSHHAANVHLLVERGAVVDAPDKRGLTPLELALQSCSNIDIAQTATLAAILLRAGARRSDRMKDFVAEIGKRFEFSRSNFNPDMLDEVTTGLDKLYALFDVPPVPRRHMHDGLSPIAVTNTKWPEQHQELWEMLVPAKGAAATVQGEVIRISGRIARELDGNGGINWDASFKQMADAFLVHVGSGTPLSPPELAEASTIVAEVKRKTGDTSRMAELAVRWVLSNPMPIKLSSPAYDR